MDGVQRKLVLGDDVPAKTKGRRSGRQDTVGKARNKRDTSEAETLRPQGIEPLTTLVGVSKTKAQKGE